MDTHIKTLRQKLGAQRASYRYVDTFRLLSLEVVTMKKIKCVVWIEYGSRKKVLLLSKISGRAFVSSFMFLHRNYQ